MKKFLYILAAVATLALASCVKQDTGLDDDLHALELRVTQLEAGLQSVKADVKSLQILAKAQQNATTILAVSPAEDGGFDITLSTGMTFHIASASVAENGVDAPALSIAQDADGLWYWTVGGEWMLDAAGAKCAVAGIDANDGVTPQIRVSPDGWWEASADGVNWVKISDSRAISVSIKVEQDEENVYFTLPDDTVITLAKESSFMFVVSSLALEVKPGSGVVELPYAISGGDSTVGFKLLSATGGYSATVVPADEKSGKVRITVPSTPGPGSVLVAAYKGSTGEVKAQHIDLSLYQDGVILVTDAAELPAEGGQVEISVSHICDFEVVIPADVDWVTLTPVTKASYVTDVVSLEVAANASEQDRKARISIVAAKGDVKTFTILQKGAEPQVDPDAVVLSWDFSSEAWQSAFASLGASGTDITGWDITVDGLRFVSSGKSKYAATYIQTGGKGSATERVFTFNAPADGTLKVWTSNTGGSSDASRLVTVVNGGSEFTNPGGSPSSDPATISEFAVKAGDVSVYPAGNGLRFYKLEFIYLAQ